MGVTISDGAGKLPVGAMDGCCTAGVLVSISVAAGASDVAIREGEDDEVGSTIAEDGGRTPVAAAEDGWTT